MAACDREKAADVRLKTGGVLQMSANVRRCPLRSGRKIDRALCRQLLDRFQGRIGGHGNWPRMVVPTPCGLPCRETRKPAGRRADIQLSGASGPATGPLLAQPGVFYNRCSMGTQIFWGGSRLQANGWLPVTESRHRIPFVKSSFELEFFGQVRLLLKDPLYCHQIPLMPVVGRLA